MKKNERRKTTKGDKYDAGEVIGPIVGCEGRRTIKTSKKTIREIKRELF